MTNIDAKRHRFDDEESLHPESRSPLYRALRYGPTVAAMLAVATGMVWLRVAFDYYEFGAVRLGGLDVWLILIGLPSAVSAGVLADVAAAWASFPSRPQVRLRGAVLATLLGSLALAALAMPGFFAVGPSWTWYRAALVVSIVGLLSIPPAALIIANRLADFMYREYRP